MILRYMVLNVVQHLDINLMSIELLKYQQTLDELLKKISQKRNELSRLSEQTVESYNGEIRVLEGRIDSLKSEIEQLDALISDKTRIAESDFNSRSTALNNRLTELESEYQKKNASLVDRENKLLSDRQKVDSDIQAVFDKQQELIRLNNDIQEKQQIHEHNVNTFNEAKDKSLKEIELLKAETVKISDENISVQQKNKQEQERLSALIDEANNKISEAQNVIKRINEASEILSKANIQKAINEQREIDLNKLSVSIKADKKRNEIKQEEIRAKERSLSIREKNIEIVESKLSKE